MTNNEESCREDQQKSNSLDHENNLTIKSNVCFKKNCHTFTTVYSNKCVTVFLKQTLGNF